MRFSKHFIQRIYRTGLLVVVILVMIDLLTYFFYPDSKLGDIFLATREQTPLTWISSLAFLFIALSCFSVYLDTKQHVWFFLSAVFFFFSMDDAVYLHERLSGILVDNTTIFSSFPSYIWVVLYFPLLAFSLASLVYLVWKDTFKQNRKIVILALLLLAGAICLDLVDGFIKKDPGVAYCLDPDCHFAFQHLSRLTEEVLEVLALGILGYQNIIRHCLLKRKS